MLINIWNSKQQEDPGVLDCSPELWVLEEGIMRNISVRLF